MPGAVISGTDTSGLTVQQWVGKSSRRIWWNASQSRWDGLMPDSTADHFIFEDIFGTPINTGIELEDRGSARPAIYWDEVNDELHVVTSHATLCEYWRIDYNSGTDTYSFGVGAAGNGEDITGFTAEAERPCALTLTPNGDVWTFVHNASGILMQRRSGGSWETGATTLDGTVGGGCVDCGWFEDTGVNNVFVVSSEDAAVAATATRNFYYIDEDAAAPTTPGNWTDESSSMPAQDGGDEADDHICCCKDSTERLWFVDKTGAGDIKIYSRTAGGTWSGTTEAWAPASAVTRPTVSIKNQSGSSDEELIITGTIGGVVDDIGYKTTPLDTVSISSETIIIGDEVGSDVMRNGAMSQWDFICDSDSGVGFIAENSTSDNVWQNTLSIDAPTSSTSDVNYRGTNRGVMRGAGRGVG